VGDTQRFRGRYRQAGGWQDIFFEDLARMDGRQCVLSIHLFLFFLMIVFKIDIQGVLARPDEGDPIVRRQRTDQRGGFPRGPWNRNLCLAGEVI
jgi:hypothetical protein